MPENRLAYTTRWQVPRTTLEYNGHVSSAMYLNYVAQLTSEHAGALGIGRA